MDAIIRVLEAVPSEVYAALIGALVALGGVALSNRSAMERLTRELRHDAQQRSQENESQLRRDTFLRAVEALSAYALFLGQFFNTNLRLEQHAPIPAEHAAALAKAGLVASPDALQVLSDANNRFAELSLELTLSKTELEQLQSQIFNINQALQAGHLDADQVQYLLGNRDALQSQLQSKIWKHWSMAVDRICDFANSLVPVNAALRREIGMPFDEAQYRKMTEENVQRLGQVMGSFLRDLRSQVSQ